MAKKQSKGKHNEYICELSSQKESDKIRELTNIPQFMCFKCGRVANAKENLCNPKGFHELESFTVPLE